MCDEEASGNISDSKKKKSHMYRHIQEAAILFRLAQRVLGARPTLIGPAGVKET